MTIKGKGRTRPRQVAKAPRRQPVVVKPRLWRRRWVQLTAAFVVGILVLWLLLWVRSSLRSTKAASDAEARAGRRVAMLSAWQAAVDGAFGTVGTLTPGAKPEALPDLTAALATLRNGRVSQGVAKTLAADATNASAAADQLDGFKASDAIREADAFDTFGTLQILDAQKSFVLALKLYARSASLGTAAARADGPQIESLAREAVRLQKLASTTLEDAYQSYQEPLLQAGLISLAPPQTASSGG
jgi:hypothetical protein